MKLLSSVHPRRAEYEIFQKSPYTTTGVRVGDFGYSGCAEWMGFLEGAKYPYQARDKVQDNVERLLYRSLNMSKIQISINARRFLNGETS